MKYLATPMKAWTQRYLTWVKTVHCEHAAQDVTLLDYLNEVEHMADRLERLVDRKSHLYSYAIRRRGSA